jgi:hypothetical protein
LCNGLTCSIGELLDGPIVSRHPNQKSEGGGRHVGERKLHQTEEKKNDLN